MEPAGKEELLEQDQSVSSSNNIVWYCPSRWLLAHHDIHARICTFSSHICLADLNNDGENLLALVDFKQRSAQESDSPDLEAANPKRTHKSHLKTSAARSSPYDCRLRVYRGQQLIYNHFLDDIPTCLIATSVATSNHHHQQKPQQQSGGSKSGRSLEQNVAPPDRPMLTLAINDDVYFYQKLQPSHRISLEDEECIMDTLDRSEFEAWQMVRQNKVEAETMRELLAGLSNELGAHQLTSHSNNFLALANSEQRKNYLTLWKFKRLNNGLAEHLMSMDTICCSAARLRFTSGVTRSGDFGQTRETGAYLNNARWNRILDLQRDGLLLGTEDRHLLIYELRSVKAHLDCHYRLPATPDHILVERKSPANFKLTSELKSLTYKILISCRNCRIYCIDQTYVIEQKRSRLPIKELLTLRCNVIDMCWTGDRETLASQLGEPNFVVACLDKRVYCFSSQDGQCKWIVESELPISCLISLPTSRGAANESVAQLIGVASQANRIDFYVSQTGRIVDSIYFANNDHCQTLTFGRFGREDNCLCVTTKLGHLLIFVLKRTAKFGHGQCLSSAASHAADALANCGHHLIGRDVPNLGQPAKQQQQEQQLKLNQTPKLPTAFALTTKSGSTNQVDQAALELLQADHNCDKVLAKSALDSHLMAPPLQIPAKSRDFVDQIVEQSRQSTVISRDFARQMIRFKEKIRTTIGQQSNLSSSNLEGNRIALLKITGLGNTYRVSLSLRLNMKHYASRHHLLSEEAALSGERAHLEANKRQENAGEEEKSNIEMAKGELLLEAHNKLQCLRPSADSEANNLIESGRAKVATVSVFLFATNQQQRRQFQVKPFSFQLWQTLAGSPGQSWEKNGWMLEKTIEFKLRTGLKQASGKQLEEESVSLDVYASIGLQDGWEENKLEENKSAGLTMRCPVFISSVNIPTC